MSPARLHRERLAAQAAGLDPSTIASVEEGGRPADAATPADAVPAAVPSIPAASPALRHRLAHVAPHADASEGDGAPLIDPAVAQIRMRLTFDLRRLKEIKAVELKIAAKREMLPEYRAWCDGLLDAGRAADGNVLPGLGADEVLPTIMVWSIDVGDWPRALELAEHVIRFGVPMPGRYERDAATLVLEEIAEAAFRAQNLGERFPLAVLEAVTDLTDGIDMHDQPRAKLAKAIGIEQARESEAYPAGYPEQIGFARLALLSLQRAQTLNPRVGVKTELKRLQKLLADNALAATAPTAPEPDTAAPADTGTTG